MMVSLELPEILIYSLIVSIIIMILVIMGIVLAVILYYKNKEIKELKNRIKELEGKR